MAGFALFTLANVMVGVVSPFLSFEIDASGFSCFTSLHDAKSPQPSIEATRSETPNSTRFPFHHTLRARRLLSNPKIFMISMKN
jgi:hypothetical protein